MCIIYKQWSISHVQIYSPLLLKRVNSLLRNRFEFSHYLECFKNVFLHFTLCTCVFTICMYTVDCLLPSCCCLSISKSTTVIKFNSLCPELYPHTHNDGNILLESSSCMYQFRFDSIRSYTSELLSCNS